MINDYNKEPSLPLLILLVAIVKISAVAFVTLIFSRYTPLVDSHLYLNGYYIQSGEFRTASVQWLALSISQFFGPYITHFVFAMFSAGGLLLYYMSGGRRVSLLLTLLFPSTLVWTSIVGKEAIYSGALGIGFVLWTIYVVRCLRWYELVLAGVSLLVCFLFRPHYAVALAWLFIATMVLNKLKGRAPIVLLFILLMGGFAVYFLAWDEILFRAFSGIEPTARASRFDYFNIIGHSPDGFERFKSLVPFGMLFGIVGPLPSEVAQRPEFSPFFIEGLIILTSPILIYILACKRLGPKRMERFRLVFFWAIVPSILILIALHAPFGLLNPGSATRWRTNFEQIFYLAPLLLFYRFNDDGFE